VSLSINLSKKTKKVMLDRLKEYEQQRKAGEKAA
jgi:hypothetical protein